MPSKRNLRFVDQLKLLASRQIDERYATKTRTQLHVTESAIDRLGLETELLGHDGCVNCLEWNESGTLLLSGSDDLRFVLWDPLLHKKKCTFETGHHGNIFSVKFLPFTNDNMVATGAADGKILVHDINKMSTTITCSCHNNRVKRIATAPSVPFLFWSAGEDGLIMEFDTRVSHTCSQQLNSLLINLCIHFGRAAEGKCLAINPSRPEQLAVGCNDPFIRLYDRRMIRPISIHFTDEITSRSVFERYQFIQRNSENNLTDDCVQYFVAGHLPGKTTDLRRKYRPLSSTYLTFSPSGSELLVNIGGEQVYLFDINNKRDYKIYHGELPDVPSNPNTISNCFYPKKMPSSLIEIIENHEKIAKQMFEKQLYNAAIREYNKAVNICINSTESYASRAKLHGNRAAAYMKRGWDGDIYAALRDCYATLELDPNYLKAYFRLAKCLFELNRLREASICLSDFRTKFPEQAYSVACKTLSLDIYKAREKIDLEASSEESDDDEYPIIVDTWNNPTPSSIMTGQEEMWRNHSADYELRFCGHCNTTTDIKEANFFGSDGQYIVAGSDDGSFFIWDRHTTNIKKIIKGDDAIVNCLQPHPSACLLATSGIDPVVRLWSPLPEDGRRNDRVVANHDDVAHANQKRMNSDPFESMLRNMGYEFPEEPQEDDNNFTGHNGPCRPS